MTTRTADASADRAPRSLTVGILTPSGSDAALAARILGQVRIEATPMGDMEAMCEAIDAGVGAIVVAEEALVGGARDSLSATLATQPDWSDVPVILLLAKGELSGAIFRNAKTGRRVLWVESS